MRMIVPVIVMIDDNDNGNNGHDDGHDDYHSVIIIVLNAIHPFIYSSIHLSIYHRNGMLWRRTSSAASRKECSEWMARKYTTLRKVRTASENDDDDGDDDGDSDVSDDDDDDGTIVCEDDDDPYIALTWCLVCLTFPYWYNISSDQM